MAAALPPTLKQINSYLKLAKEYDKRDPTVAYFCRMYAVHKGIKLDSKSPEAKKFLFGMMDNLENVKKELTGQGDESVTNDIVGQAHLENITVNLFTWADGEDRKANFNKNVVKAFYSSSLLYDVLTQFSELSEECSMQQRYAKWKATEIHKCLQRGETPVPGPAGSEFEGTEFGATTSGIGSMQLNDGSANTPYPPANMDQPGPSGYTPEPVPAPRKPSNQAPPPSSGYVAPAQASVENSHVDFQECSKLCKYAMSALDYEDVDTAVANLTKALNMLQNR
ncbi:vacuolar protein sorting-associated protein VTA1 homolog [Clytia hemisphaerica]|uniref:Uncharacterized protein n=1 Tax=Clytia hemisphaerica TaxID=252671 RepID=A0A7M5U101_9CNID|eukprot:TCONS_00004657-protein